MKLLSKSKKEKFILFLYHGLGRHAPHSLRMLAIDIKAHDILSKGKFVRKVWREIGSEIASGQIYWPSPM